MNAELESRVRDSLHGAKLPPASDYLRNHAASVIQPTVAAEPKPVDQSRSWRSRPWLLLPAAAILVALAGLSLLIPGASPPTVVDGLPVLSVSQLLAQRAAGGLRNQSVAVGGFWSYDPVAMSCPTSSGQPGRLELYCSDGMWGIAERDEPIFLVGRYGQIIWQAQGPHLTPYFYTELPGSDQLSRLLASDGTPYPPAPIVVVGHFDDPLADDCRTEARQLCLDRLVIDKIAYLNLGATRWAPGIPTIEPSPPPPPPRYSGQ